MSVVGRRVLVPWIAIALVAALVDLAVVANREGAGPATVVASASDQTTTARTAKVAETMTTTGSKAQTTTADGVIDFVTRRVSLDLTIAGEKITALSDGTIIYEHIPSLASSLGGKSWIKIDLNQLGEMAGISGLGNLQTTNNDPGVSLDSLRGAGSVTKVGTETVRGTSTTHFHAVIDFNAAAGKASAAQAATLRQIATKLGVTAQPVDVWVDAQGRARRLVETVDYSHAHLPGVTASNVPPALTIAVEYYDFGTPVDVTVPSADQVTDLATALGSSGDGRSTYTTFSATGHTIQ